MEFLCKNCQHCDVCRFKKDYEKTMDNLNVKIPTPFSIELKCPHYKTPYHNLYANSWTTITGSTADGIGIKSNDITYCAESCTDASTVDAVDGTLATSISSFVE